jgi:hypothetical protein
LLYLFVHGANKLFVCVGKQSSTQRLKQVSNECDSTVEWDAKNKSLLFATSEAQLLLLLLDYIPFPYSAACCLGGRCGVDHPFLPFSVVVVGSSMPAWESWRVMSVAR